MKKLLITLGALFLIGISALLYYYLPDIRQYLATRDWNTLYSSKCNLQIKYPEKWTGNLYEHGEYPVDCLIRISTNMYLEDIFITRAPIQDVIYANDIKGLNDTREIGEFTGYYRQDKPINTFVNNTIYFENNGYGYTISYDNANPGFEEKVKEIYNTIRLYDSPQGNSHIENPYVYTGKYERIEWTEPFYNKASYRYLLHAEPLMSHFITIIDGKKVFDAKAAEKLHLDPLAIQLIYEKTEVENMYPSDTWKSKVLTDGKLMYEYPLLYKFLIAEKRFGDTVNVQTQL